LALEKGLLLIKDILILEDPLAYTLRVSDILEYIVGMFKRFCEAEKENEDVGDPKLPVHGQKGLKIVEDVHSKIAQIGLDISVSMLKRGGPQFDVEVLHKFLKS
jgi:hypothetical protein